MTTAIISHELRLASMKTIIDLLRASAPCTEADIIHEVLVQTVGGTKESAIDALDRLRSKRGKKPTVVEYEMFPSSDPDDVCEPAYELSETYWANNS